MKYSETFVVDPDQACQLQSVMLQRILICRSIRDHRQQQQLISTETWLVLHKVYIYLRQRKRYMFLLLFICLSVCLLARLLKNACMNLGEMLCVGSNWDLKKHSKYVVQEARCRRHCQTDCAIFCDIEHFHKSLEVTYCNYGLYLACAPFLGYSVLNNGVTLKFGFGVVQGHWNCYQSKALVQFPIRLS